MLPARCVLILLVGLGSSAAAGDVATVMAALKDEAAECRYLRQLCDNAAIAKRMADEATANATP